MLLHLSKHGEANQEVELVEVAVDEALCSEACQQVHALRVHESWLPQFTHLCAVGLHIWRQAL